ncbi:hypothetical protein V8G54_026845 [Vigna mungo]|uniref:Uncharacterized protein n=1 Tax=Vigna mungo TaxID=3915 RepID=A0AAQ3N138_VIGMU
MTSAPLIVLVYFNGTTFTEENYSKTYISSETAWVTIIDTMNIVEVKQTILNNFNMSALNQYQVELQYRLPIYICGGNAHYRSCNIAIDDDLEAIFFMATQNVVQVQVEIMAFITSIQPNTTPNELCYDLSNNFSFSLNLH